MASNSTISKKYFCANIPSHMSYKCNIPHVFSPHKTDVRRMICPFFKAGNCGNAERCHFAHVQEHEIEFSNSEAIVNYDYPLEEAKTNLILKCNTCRAPYPKRLYNLHFLNCPHIKMNMEIPAIKRSASIVCGLCRVPIIRKIKEDCFGLLYNCSHAFCYGCLINLRKISAFETDFPDEGTHAPKYSTMQHTEAYGPNETNTTMQTLSPYQAQSSEGQQCLNSTMFPSSLEIDENGFCVPNMRHIWSSKIPSTPNAAQQEGSQTTPATRHELSPLQNSTNRFCNQSIPIQDVQPTERAASNRVSKPKNEFGIVNASRNQIWNVEGPTNYACPICGTISKYLIPSRIWTTNKEEKENLLLLQKFKWKEVSCVRFEQYGRCDFGNSCYFFHAAQHLNTK